jgi:hypothetical protein
VNCEVTIRCLVLRASLLADAAVLKLKVRMKLCIICLEREPDPQKPEHILLNALGGRMKTKEALCSDCNNKFGSGPDFDLAKSVEVLRCVANLKSGDGKRPPAIRNMDVGDEEYDLLPGGRPISKSKNPLIFKDVPEGVQVTIKARDEEHARTLLTQAAKRLKIPEPEVNEFVSKELEAATKNIGFAPAATHGVHFGSGRSQQSMAKACLVLWAELVGNSELHDVCYSQMRNFSKLGVEADIALKTEVSRSDDRVFGDFEEKFAPSPNFIWVGSDKFGRVFGYFRLLNIIGWRFELANSSTILDRAICLMSNPFNNGTWDVLYDEHAPKLFQWLQDMPEPTLPDSQNITDAMGRFLKLAYQNSHETEVDAIFKETLQQTKLSENDILTEEEVHLLSSDISMRLAHYFTRTPRNEPLSQKEKPSGNGSD